MTSVVRVISLAVLAPLLVAACMNGNANGFSPDAKRQDALIQALIGAYPNKTIDLAEVLDAPGGSVLSLPFASKDEAFRAVHDAFNTDVEGVWPGPGSGAIVTVTHSDGSFLAWFGMPDSVAAMCFDPEVMLDDHTFRVLEGEDGGRLLSADDATCQAAAND